MIQRNYQPPTTQKVCQCKPDCGVIYLPTSHAQRYAPGHAPTNTPKKPMPVQQSGWPVAAQPSPAAPHTRQNPMLDYKLALATAQKELETLTKEIDDADNEMEGFRAGIASMQMIKDKAVQRHEDVSACIDALKILANEVTSAQAS